MYYIYKIISIACVFSGYHFPTSTLEGGMTWFYGSTVFCSAMLYYKYGGIDFTAMPGHSGPYGIGMKRIWSSKHSNHILVFYPITKE